MIIGDGIMLGAGGETASIFVTGLSETDTVTASKDGKTVVGKWTQKPNPNCIGLPNGYTQLEYIESTGTQYINTNHTPTTNTVWETDFQFIGDQSFAGQNSGANGSLRDGSTPEKRFAFLYLNETGKWQFGVGTGIANDGIADNNRHIFTVRGNGTCSVDSTDYSTGGTATGGQIWLFDWYHTSANDTRPVCGRLYSTKILESGTIVKHLIPSKRNSDNEIGLYDLVNDVFYTNSGTGEFNTGSEIPQTIDGHMLSPIRELGTWTVTATDGEETATQDVLVDVITEYEIEMSLTA